jgi:phenylalanyl-tRNA synthetase beta chain
MKISISWMSQLFADLERSGGLMPHTAILRERLPLSGIEIGSVHAIGGGLDAVIVGQILSFERHPQADRLNVCKVQFKEGAEPLQIVCGASNVRAGMKVALAPVGTVLPGDFKIKEAKIRNVDSFGMLCSEKELGLSEESKGIMDLPEAAPLGSPIVKALGLKDEVWDIELTADRGDCLSLWGLAREVGRIVGKEPKFLPTENINPKDAADVALVSVEVQDKKACPIYGAQKFDGIQNGPTPAWLKRLVETLGHRSHNLLVDLTNAVLLETGHPMHAFDAEKIRGSKVIVRFAKDNEELLLLDGQTIKLTSKDLVIADLERPLALAGIMGGLDSSVTEKTQSIVLETAVFDADLVRASAKRHKLHTESSHRFERGVDASRRLFAPGRFAFLLKQLNPGARKRGSYVEVMSEKGEKLTQNMGHNFDLRAFKDVVGIDVSGDDLVRAFQSVGIDAQSKSTNVLRIEVPAHRHDLSREIDLVEEGARLIGYDKILPRYPAQKVFSKAATRSLYSRLRMLRLKTLETGLTEVMPYSFYSQADVAHTPKARLVTLENPLSQDWLYMRPNLTLGLLKTLAHHSSLAQYSARVFDCGSAFDDTSSELAFDAKSNARLTATRESQHLAWAMMGQRSTEHWSSDKKSDDRKANVDFFDAKGILESLLESLSTFDPKWPGLRFWPLASVPVETVEKEAPWIPLSLLHPTRSAIVCLPTGPLGQIVGYVGELSPILKGDVLNLATGLNLGVALGEIRLITDLLKEMDKAAVQPLANPNPRGKIALSRKLPIVERDFALVVADSVQAAELERTLKKAVGPELLSLRCVDLFKLSDGKVSLAFRAEFQGLDKTLVDADIQGFTQKLLKAAADKHQASLR